MGKIKCNECGNEVNSFKSVCPHCKSRLLSGYYKKVFLIIALIFAFIIFACCGFKFNSTFFIVLLIVVGCVGFFPLLGVILSFFDSLSNKKDKERDDYDFRNKIEKSLEDEKDLEIEDYNKWCEKVKSLSNIYTKKEYIKTDFNLYIWYENNTYYAYDGNTSKERYLKDKNSNGVYSSNEIYLNSKMEEYNKITARDIRASLIGGMYEDIHDIANNNRDTKAYAQVGYYLKIDNIEWEFKSEKDYDILQKFIKYNEKRNKGV